MVEASGHIENIPAWFCLAMPPQHPGDQSGACRLPANQLSYCHVFVCVFFFFLVWLCFPQSGVIAAVQRQIYPSLSTRWPPLRLTADPPLPPSSQSAGLRPVPPRPLMHCGFQCKAAAALRSFRLVVSVGVLLVWRPLWVAASISLLLLGSLEEGLQRHTTAEG